MNSKVRKPLHRESKTPPRYVPGMASGYRGSGSRMTRGGVLY